jgi:hypothetical protein
MKYRIIFWDNLSNSKSKFTLQNKLPELWQMPDSELHADVFLTN